MDDLRLRGANDVPERDGGEYVLYWMTAFRRTRYNFALQRACERAAELGLPLVVLEPLRAGYDWACDRFHRFVIEGMADNAERFERAGVLYHPYVEPEPGAGRGLLEALAARAALVVTDDYPCFFLPRMVAAAGRKLDVRLELVDSNGLLPLRATEKVHPTAYAFRRTLQKELPPYLSALPLAEPLDEYDLPRAKGLPRGVAKRWPAAELDAIDLSELPIDHSVGPVEERGGSVRGGELVAEFLDSKLPHYLDRNQPERDVSSGLSFHLHFGHVSSHEVFHELALREDWTPDRLADSASGKRQGWWGMSEPAEGFLDELVTWREVGYNFTSKRDDFDAYESLPDWARATLEEHASDPRPHLYTLEDFEEARTHDDLWNAAQRQLVREGRIHNYLRMLWGKKILEWTRSPREALDVMIELNNKYAVDGRDPNSYSGIFWVLGRYDRAWGPERDVFGKIRYMTSANTARKVRVKDYVERYAEAGLFD